MGCVSSTLLDQADELTQLDSSSLSHHIVSLTSTTYGLLSIDPPPSQTPPRFNPKPPLAPSEPEIINSWELMAGLDSDSSRFTPPSAGQTRSKQSCSSSLLHTVAELDSRISKPISISKPNKENQNPNHPVRAGLSNSTFPGNSPIPRPLNSDKKPRPSSAKYTLDEFKHRCPPGGENRVVLYTTSLRGVRKTFEECNAVRAALESIGVMVCERDLSMHRIYREELRDLMKFNANEDNGSNGCVNGCVLPPRLFVKGRYIGGVEEVLRINEEGGLMGLMEGVDRRRFGDDDGGVCDGCGGVAFLPCFDCSGSCKIVKGRDLVMRCPVCNENGLVVCPICS